MSGETHPIPVVAVVNSNDDVVEMLRMTFEQAGLIVVSAHVDKIKRGETSLADFIAEHKPSVVVYDLIPPYDRSYRFLEHLRSNGQLAGCQFVLTSTNAKRAQELSGAADEIYEVVGKPYDIEQLTRTVKEASRARATR